MRNAPPYPSERKRLLGRVGPGIVDQGLSSVTNFALSVFAGRYLTATAFGAFGITFVVYLLILGASRALATQPFVVLYSDHDRVDRRPAKGALGVALALSLGLGVACTALGLVLGGEFGRSCAALGLCAPGLVVQDAWRFVFLAEGRPSYAMANDGAWTLAQVVFFAGVLLIGDVSAPRLILAWGASALVAAVFGMFQARCVPSPKGWVARLRRERHLAVPYLGEFIATQAASHATTLVVAALIGLAASGAFRGSDVVLGPLQTLFMGVGLVAVPEVIRRYRSAMALERAMRKLSVLLLLAAAAWCAVAILIPSSVGRELLGASWARTRSVLPMTSMAMLGYALGYPAGLGLRAVGAARVSLRVCLITSSVTGIAGVAGAMLGGLSGAVVGFALAGFIAALVTWRSFRAVLARLADGDSGEPVRSLISTLTES